MDVENLAKELILKNMTPEQQMAVLDSVRSSVAQAKEVQKRKIGENVDLVVQALKKIETDIRSRFDDVGNAIEKRVSTIKDGRDGINGKDGRDGKDGRNGRDGAKGDKGEHGQDGRDGIDGVDGVSVSNARIDFDGSLIITLSNGIELNVGEVVAPDLAESIKVITNGGGTAQFVLDTLTSLQTQINNLIPSQTGNSGKYLTTNGTALSWASVAGGLSYQGTWNATTNTPTLASSVGVNGYYYIVATAGSTNLNGITDWQIGDWLMFNGSVWQKIDQSDVVQSITSADASIVVTTTGSTVDLSVSQTSPASVLVEQVRNSTGATLTKGTAVYISGATGQLPTVSKALANADVTSAQTLGLITADISNNSNGYVTIIGLMSNLNTSAYTDGAQLYLSPTTAGTLTATKPYAPQHLVYVAVVAHAHPTQGKLLVKVQNGYEMDELHNVSAQSPTSGQTLIYNASTSLWEKANLTAGTGISVSNGAGSITVTNSGVSSAVAGTGISVSSGTGAVTISNTGVTSVTGTSPVASSGGATPAISLAASYGDTQNPYASKTAKFVLAAPNAANGVPTFRAVVASDIPTLNQSTTGSAATLTTPRAIYGNNFDGSAALTQVIASTYGGTGNGFTKFTGATTAEKTYTLPDASSTIVVQGGALGTPSSGTVTNLTGTASININGTVGATTPAAGTFTTLSSTGNTTIGDAVTDTITVNGLFVTGTVLRSAQTATNTLALAAYDVDGTAYTNLVTLTASNTPTLALTSTGVGTINNMSVGATTASTGAFTTLSATGVTTVQAGTAALPAITTSGDTNTGIFFPAADTIAFSEGGVEAMRLNSSGNVLVGTTSAATPSTTGFISVANTFGFKNRIINGAMVIDQRFAGTSTTPSSGAYLLDRFFYTGTQASKFGFQQNYGGVTLPAGFTNYLGMYTVSAVSVGAGDTFLVTQNIEGFNTADLDFGKATARTVTLSFQAYSSLTGTFGGCLMNSASNRSYPFSYSVPAANTWTQISVTIAGDTSGTWVGATNGTGLIVRFGLGSGATFSGTAGAWAAGNLVQPTGTVSVVGTLGATFFITGVQLEKGSTATSFDYRPIGTELALCQRYYYRVSAIDNRYYGSGQVSNTGTTAVISVPFPVTMRVVPTALDQTGTASNYKMSQASTANVSCTSVPTLAGNGTEFLGAVAYTASSLGGTAGQMTMGSTNGTGYLGFSAEL
jgi:hypothetical protein